MIDDPVFSVTETGISAPSYEEIYEYLKGRMRAIFGDDINLTLTPRTARWSALWRRLSRT